MFNEPKSIEEARERRTKMACEVNRLQHELGNRDVRVDGRRLNDREWWVWKKNLQEKWLALLEEFRLLKDWIATNEANLKRQVRADMEDMLEGVKGVKEYLKKVTTNAYALQERIAELTAENNALHKRLQEYELQQTNEAPGEGREPWRHDDVNDTGVKAETL